MAYLKLVDISKNFGRLKALSGINLDIPEGTFTVVLGPSGCGKSTLLNVVAGLEEPTTGEIYLQGQDITRLATHKRDFAFVFQNYALYPHLSVYENMAFGLRLKGLAEKDIRVRIRVMSEMLHIVDKLESFPRELSGGQRQRVATGRAIVREPKLFLFDEPLSNLDARLRDDLRAEFIKLHKHFKKTTIYVTHDQQEALVLAEQLIILRDGRIEQVGNPGDVYQNPQNLFVAEFIGTPAMNIIDTKVRVFEEKTVLKNLDFKFLLPPQFDAKARNYRDKTIYLGFRANALKFSQEGQLVGEVIFIERIGDERYAHIIMESEIEIKAKLPEGLKLNSGQLVRLDIEPAKMYFFDAEGKRIYL